MIKYILMAAGIFAGDSAIKNHVEREFPNEGEQKRLQGLIRLKKHYNKGAFLNVGEKKQGLVVIISVLLTVVVTVLFILSLGTKGNTCLRTGLALLLGGGFCNTYDRLKRKYVVDYVSFGVKWKWFSNIIFNISDFAIIIGAFMTAISIHTLQ